MGLLGGVGGDRCQPFLVQLGRPRGREEGEALCPRLHGILGSGLASDIVHPRGAGRQGSGGHMGPLTPLALWAEQCCKGAALGGGNLDIWG